MTGPSSTKGGVWRISSGRGRPGPGGGRRGSLGGDLTPGRPGVGGVCRGRCPPDGRKGSQGSTIVALRRIALDPGRPLLPKDVLERPPVPEAAVREAGAADARRFMRPLRHSSTKSGSSISPIPTGLRMVERCTSTIPNNSGTTRRAPARSGSIWGAKRRPCASRKQVPFRCARTCWCSIREETRTRS